MQQTAHSINNYLDVCPEQLRDNKAHKDIDALLNLICRISTVHADNQFAPFQRTGEQESLPHQESMDQFDDDLVENDDLISFSTAASSKAPLASVSFAPKAPLAPILKPTGASAASAASGSASAPTGASAASAPTGAFAPTGASAASAASGSASGVSLEEKKKRKTKKPVDEVKDAWIKRGRSKKQKRVTLQEDAGHADDYATAAEDAGATTAFEDAGATEAEEDEGNAVEGNVGAAVEDDVNAFPTYQPFADKHRLKHMLPLFLNSADILDIINNDLTTLWKVLSHNKSNKASVRAMIKLLRRLNVTWGDKRALAEQPQKMDATKAKFTVVFTRITQWANRMDKKFPALKKYVQPFHWMAQDWQKDLEEEAEEHLDRCAQAAADASHGAKGASTSKRSKGAAASKGASASHGAKGASAPKSPPATTHVVINPHGKKILLNQPRPPCRKTPRTAPPGLYMQYRAENEAKQAHAEDTEDAGITLTHPDTFSFIQPPVLDVNDLSDLSDEDARAPTAPAVPVPAPVAPAPAVPVPAPAVPEDAPAVPEATHTYVPGEGDLALAETQVFPETEDDEDAAKESFIDALIQQEPEQPKEPQVPVPEQVQPVQPVQPVPEQKEPEQVQPVQPVPEQKEPEQVQPVQPVQPVPEQKEPVPEQPIRTLQQLAFMQSQTQDSQALQLLQEGYISLEEDSAPGQEDAVPAAPVQQDAPTKKRKPSLLEDFDLLLPNAALQDAYVFMSPKKHKTQ